jgi:hypothetical protein
MQQWATQISAGGEIQIEVEGLDAFVDVLSKEIQALGPGNVGTVDSGTRESDAFLRKNRYLYASLKDIQELRDTLVDRYEYEVSKAAGFGALLRVFLPLFSGAAGPALAQWVHLPMLFGVLAVVTMTFGLIFRPGRAPRPPP